MPTNITTDTKGSKATLIKTRGHEKLRITAIPPVLADRRQLMPSVILGGGEKNLVKQKLPT
jgi:hypothetical protein